MKNLLLPLILAVNCASAAPAPVSSDAQYAGKIAKAFSQLDSPARLLELANVYTPAADQRQLLESAIGLKMPQVKAIGPLLQFNFSGRIENLKVIDGQKNLFEFHGVEIDLSPSRSLSDRLRQINELRTKTAGWWSWILPSAYAAGPAPDSVSVMAAGIVSQAYTDGDKFENAGRAAFKLKMMCEELEQDPKSKLLTLVPPELADDVIQVSNAKKPKYKRDVSNWQAPIRAYLEKVKPRYCTSQWGDWWNKHNLFSDDDSVAHRENACENITKAIQCYKGLEAKTGVTLYPPQHKFMADLTRIIEPDGGSAAATALAKDVGVQH